MGQSDPKSIVLRFNDRINNQDVNGLVKLMTENHTFIDIPGRVTRGREKMKKDWVDFFESFPDYRNIFSRVETKGNLVIMIGHSECTDERLHGPAIWTAVIEDDHVAEWRVYKDTPEVRQLLGID